MYTTILKFLSWLFCFKWASGFFIWHEKQYHLGNYGSVCERNEYFPNQILFALEMGQGVDATLTNLFNPISGRDASHLCLINTWPKEECTIDISPRYTWLRKYSLLSRHLCLYMMSEHCQILFHIFYNLYNECFLYPPIPLDGANHVLFKLI